MIVNGALKRLNQNETRSIYEKQTPIDRMWSYLNQVIGDYSFGKIIRINQLGDWLLGKCMTNRKEVLEYAKHQNNSEFRYTRLSFIVSLIQEFAVYIFLVYQVFASRMSLGDFFLYIAAVSAFTNAMTNIIGYCVNMNDTGKYVDDYRNFLELPVKINQQNGQTLNNEVIEKIRFNHVSFRYPGTEIIF